MHGVGDGKQGIHISLAWEGPGINEIGLFHSTFPFTVLNANCPDNSVLGRIYEVLLNGGNLFL